MTSNSKDRNESADSGNEVADTIYFEEYKPPFLPLLLLAFPILPLFWTYHVKLDEKQISFGYNYGIVSKAIERSAIKSVEPIEHINGLFEWGGWGIRKNLKWHTGYIATNGPGVRLTLCDGGNDYIYVFNCKDPKKLCELLTTSK